MGDSLERAPWDRRKVLVCTPDEYRAKLARTLTQEGYQVFVASDTKQAVERMRENPLDIVILEPNFDAADQGAAFVVREVNVLRPAPRRRLFFVLLSPTLRTMDAHAAFLNNVNAVVNLRDLDDLPRVLGHALREYNDLYKDFNATLGVMAI
jgi:response regulator RpfG family c-di-GMP phosphodiesterase